MFEEKVSPKKELKDRSLKAVPSTKTAVSGQNEDNNDVSAENSILIGGGDPNLMPDGGKPIV